MRCAIHVVLRHDNWIKHGFNSWTLLEGEFKVAITQQLTVLQICEWWFLFIIDDVSLCLLCFTQNWEFNQLISPYLPVYTLDFRRPTRPRTIWSVPRTVLRSTEYKLVYTRLHSRVISPGSIKTFRRGQLYQLSMCYSSVIFNLTGVSSAGNASARGPTESYRSRIKACF